MTLSVVLAMIEHNLLTSLLHHITQDTRPYDVQQLDAVRDQNLDIEARGRSGRLFVHSIEFLNQSTKLVKLGMYRYNVFGLCNTTSRA